MNDLYLKHKRLKDIIKSYESVLVAFSGGVDSTLLLKAAHDVLRENVLAVTATSEIYPPGEAVEAGDIAGHIGAKHMIFEARGLKVEGFSKNPPDRCYLCKKDLYAKLLETAGSMGFQQVVDGVNADDTDDYRPGLRAGEELGVKTPLKDAGLTKSDVYSLSRILSLPNAGKPASPCLATRFPYGTEITRAGLQMVSQAEEYLKELGIPQIRVRHHGNLARIEASQAFMGLVMEKSGEVSSKLKQIGYGYIALDLQGYRTGSMNEALEFNNKAPL